MYKRLVETAEQWGHQGTSQREAFFGYPKDLNLDTRRFAASHDGPATLKRIGQSQQDGRDPG